MVACRGCLEEWFRRASVAGEAPCPQCRRPFAGCVTAKEAGGQVAQLCSRCPFVDSGCRYRTVIGTDGVLLRGHAASCTFRTVPCPYCAEEMPNRTLFVHLELRCPRRRVACPDCGADMLWDDLQAHRRQNRDPYLACPGQLRCPRGCLTSELAPDDIARRPLLNVPRPFNFNSAAANLLERLLMHVPAVAAGHSLPDSRGGVMPDAKSHSQIAAVTTVAGAARSAAESANGSSAYNARVTVLAARDAARRADSAKGSSSDYNAARSAADSAKGSSADNAGVTVLAARDLEAHALTCPRAARACRACGEKIENRALRDHVLADPWNHFCTLLRLLPPEHPTLHI